MKKKILIAALSAGLLAALSGCGQNTLSADSVAPASSAAATVSVPDSSAPVTVTPVPTETEIPAETVAPEETEPIPDGMMKSSLTGEYVSKEIGSKRPIAFMMDNVEAADPQSGLSAASIYYEAPVEGNLTRLCVVFEDTSGLKRIGPLRSCRDYFISLVSGLDCIYTHYGRAAYALPYLESDDVDNISGLLSSTYDCFFRDYTFHSGVHTAYTSDEGIQKAIGIRGYSTEHKKDYTPEYKFSWVGKEVTLDNGEDASYVAPGYPYDNPKFFYDSETGLYKRYEYGSAHVDAENNEQITVKNIILEYENYALYQNSVYVHFDTTSGGRGKYITGGKAVDITWKRPSFYEPVKYYGPDGKEITLNTGKTWVSVIQCANIADCKIGASEDTAHCVVSDTDAASIAAYNSEWTAAYKYGEDEYLSGMAALLKQELAAHDGQTKVGEGD